MDIRGPFIATLDALAFEGVTKRSRPNLVPGDLVYARVKAAPRDADPEIVCVDGSGKVSTLRLRHLTCTRLTPGIMLQFSIIICGEASRIKGMVKNLGSSSAMNLYNNILTSSWVL